jgi:hypothetical protein
METILVYLVSTSSKKIDELFGNERVGSPRYYSTSSEGGGHNKRGFCAECGSRLFGRRQAVFGKHHTLVQLYGYSGRKNRADLLVVRVNLLCTMRKQR